MLSHVAGSALSVPSDERHSYQASVAKMIGETLGSSVKSWENKLSEAHAAVSSTTKEKENAIAALADTKSKREQKQGEVKSREEQLHADTKAESDAKQGLKAANKEVTNFDSNFMLIPKLRAMRSRA